MTNEELNEAIRYLEEERLTVEAILYGENQDKFDNTIMLIDDAKFRLSRKPLTIYDMAIQALEQQSITWIVGKDNCQVAVRNMPIDKMQKICTIIGDEEQQSCENKIIEWKKDFKGFINALSMPRDDYKGIMKYIDELPVTSKPKTGHWEYVQYDYNPDLGNWHCSECRNIVIECVNKNDKGGIPIYKYCPNCGARMESEDEK